MKCPHPAALSLALVASALAHQAQAAEQVYRFTYDSPANEVVIVGELLGTLQANGNTVLVSQVLGVPLLNGRPTVAVPFVDSVVNVVAGVSLYQPIVSLNGMVMDFAACTSTMCADGFGFESGGVFGGPVSALLSSFGNLGTVPYSPGEWSMSVVPELNAWAMMALGLAGLGLYRRKRSGQRAGF